MKEGFREGREHEGKRKEKPCHLDLEKGGSRRRGRRNRVTSMPIQCFVLLCTPISNFFVPFLQNEDGELVSILNGYIHRKGGDANVVGLIGFVSSNQIVLCSSTYRLVCVCSSSRGMNVEVATALVEASLP